MPAPLTKQPASMAEATLVPGKQTLCCPPHWAIVQDRSPLTAVPCSESPPAACLQGAARGMARDLVPDLRAMLLRLAGASRWCRLPLPGPRSCPLSLPALVFLPPATFLLSDTLDSSGQGCVTRSRRGWGLLYFLPTRPFLCATSFPRGGVTSNPSSVSFPMPLPHPASGLEPGALLCPGTKRKCPSSDVAQGGGESKATLFPTKAERKASGLSAFAPALL